MRYGVLGTGTVGRTIAAKLRALGHDVQVGSRTAGADTVTFADAARYGETVVNATSGVASLAALEQAGAEHLAGKVLVDVANPIAPDSGMPPQLAFCNDDSLGERIQRAFPDARVVKTLNTVNADVMVDPSLLPGEHHVFVCGADPAAKQVVAGMLQEFGWPASAVLDLGGIEAARGTEMYLALWLRLMFATGTAHLNIAVTSAT